MAIAKQTNRFNNPEPPTARDGAQLENMKLKLKSTNQPVFSLPSAGDETKEWKEHYMRILRPFGRTTRKGYKAEAITVRKSHIN